MLVQSCPIGSRILMKTTFVKWRFGVVSLGVATLFSCGPLGAQPIFTGALAYNTNQPDFGSFPVVASYQWLASPFLTGPNPALLNSVTIYEKTFDSSGGTFHLSLYSDNNGVPGNALAGGLLNGALTPQGFSFETYTASQPISLAPNSLYWVVASSDNPGIHGGAYGWAWAANSNYTST